MKCGRCPKDEVKLEVDHRVPYEKGGTDGTDNLQTLTFDKSEGVEQPFYGNSTYFPKFPQLSKTSYISTYSTPLLMLHNSP